MAKIKRKPKRTVTPPDRDLVIAYISYALEDVRGLSRVGAYLLELAIATIRAQTKSDRCH